jgi:hypothetical protein
MTNWINADHQKPPLVDGQYYSKAVWGFDGNEILVVTFHSYKTGTNWVNCYGDVLDPDIYEWDDDYDIKYWMPIDIPEPPPAPKEPLFQRLFKK